MNASAGIRMKRPAHERAGQINVAPFNPAAEPTSLGG